MIYSKASAATRAIKDYNLAQIDNRTMRVDLAAQQTLAAKPVETAQRAIPARKTDGRIGKSGRGRTLNVTGRRN